MAALTPMTNTATVPDLWDNAFKTLKEKDKQNVDFQRTDKRAILEDVLVEVQKKKQDCLTRRLKYKRSNGDSVHIYDVCEKIVKWVNTFKEVGDAAVQYDPGHAALPWAAIRFFLQVAVNDVQIFGNLADGLEVVSKTVAHYAAIEENYLRQPSSVDTKLQDLITATYASILRFLSRCRRYFDLGQAQRFARSIVQLPEMSTKKHLDRIAENDRWVTKWTSTIDAERLVNGLGELRVESTESASKLEALLTNFNEPMIRTMNQVSTLSGRLVDIRNESQLKKDRLTILKWLSDVQYKKHHQTLSKGLLEGTGKWLLNKHEYVEWRNSSVSSVLWLHGIPGSGKTYLAANVVKHLLAEKSTYENAAPIAYFYCQRNTADIRRSNPTEVLRAILKQIMLGKADWESESPTAKEYRRRKKEADEDGSDIECFDLLETTQHIIDAVGEMPVTIIIDALDECHTDQRPQLLNALDLLLEKSAHLVKVFISSRDDIDIVLKLQKHRNIYIGVDDNKQDINRFIQSEMQKVQSEGRLLKGMVSSELQDSITENLARKAQGMFLWVNLQIQNLCDSRRIKVEDDLLEELTRLPQTLAGMYSLILENISQIEQHGRSIAETVLKWLLCAFDSSSAIIIAACSAENSRECRTLSVHDVLDVCSNLVIYDEALDRFRFAHLSVREFLESQPGYTSSEVNQSVAKKLLQILMSPRSENLKIVRLYEYATCHWTYHYHKVEEQRRKEFFEHCAKGFFFNSAESSEAYETWAAKVSQYPFGWLEEEWSFVRRRGPGFFLPYIVKSPLLLACRFGWLEIVDHCATYQINDGYSEPTTEMMKVAIQHGSALVVRWLLARNVCLTVRQLELAIHFQQAEILQIFLAEISVSCNMLEYGQEDLVLTFRHELKNIYDSSENSGISRLFKDGERILWRVQGLYEDCTAFLIVRWGTDSMLRDASIRAHCMRMLDSTAIIPTPQSESSVSGSTRCGRHASAPDHTMQGISQKLLILAAVCWQEGVFRALLSPGTDPTCSAICEAQKQASTVTHRGHSLCRQQIEGRKHRRYPNKIIVELKQGLLAWASYTGNVSLVQSILDQDMDPNIQNRKGQTALYFAAQQTEDKYSHIDLEADKEAIVRLLLRKGALVTSADGYGGATVLAHAFKARYSKIVQILLENGAQIPKGVIGGPVKQLLDAFEHGREGIRETLLERVQAAEVHSLDLQPPISRFCWPGDPVGVAAELALGGTMRVLGDVILAACEDTNDLTQT